MMNAAGTRKFKARELPVRLEAHIVSKVRQFESYNVLGFCRARTASATQAVVYSAHYDHLGSIRRWLATIFTTARSTTHGLRVLLELARPIPVGSEATAPGAVRVGDGGRKGLLGSNYLGKHLPIAAAQIALDLNFDAIPPIGVPESVNVTGAERTTFFPMVEKTSKAFGFEIQPDAEPGAGHYYRSDHFSLARAGVPAFSINTALKFAGHPPNGARRSGTSTREALSPAERRVLGGYGLCEQCGPGQV